MRLLVLEDDPRLADSYANRLRIDGFAVDEVCTIDEARRALIDVDYDCLVLDRVLPDGDALDLMEHLQGSPERAPVLMLSGTLGDSVARIEGLEAGADDYLTKPVQLDELAVRVRRLTARVGGVGRRQVAVDIGSRVRLDKARREVRLDGRPIHLSPTQYAVFTYLVANMHRLVPVEELLDHCWDRHRHLFANPAHSQITRLRRIFAGALEFESVRGVGYVIRVPGDDEGA